ncbi:MAG: CRISPR-associated helicase/endonuclease Cas3 [Candidatus Contendobacter sp.]|nr:CRISPR-associated helicase/endonuclease Cas3 [Candidatus Contendobacter sp.]MDG4556689.1 CRISPR-associated helicase/endonuclease Cas3 [Candidatus Contendobacter sp.]
MASTQDRFFRYWGKTHGDDYHLLVYHALDVAAVGMVWWDACPAIRRALAQAFHIAASETGQLRAWMLFFLALHDLGKLDVRFQLKAPDTLRRLWPQFSLDDVDESKGTIGSFDHGASGFDWAIRECIDWFGEVENAKTLEDCWQRWLAAVTGHHGDIASHGSSFRAPAAEDEIVEQDRQARRDFIDAVADLFLKPEGLGLTSPALTCETAAQHLLAGFCSVCDWIGSNTDAMPYVTPDPTGSLADYVNERAREFRDGRWLQRFGLIGSARAYQGVSALLKPEETPRGVQVLVEGWPLAPGLTLIEAPTGSGKTEAALAYAWRLLESETVDSVVFALPTQATANAMLARAEAFAAKAFAGDATHIVLAHGKRWFHPGFKQLLAAGQRPTAQGNQEATRQCATWLAQSRKRVFLGQVGICTVDQVLLSVLPVRHQFVRGFGIGKSVLIVDEVHAYDRYMHGLLAEVLRRQKAAGGNVVLLSATLPSGVRDRLLEAWQATGSEQAPYPAVWCAMSGAVTPSTVPDEQRPPRREVATELFKLPGAFPDDALLDRLIAAGQAGARVAVILNLVDDAQRLARLLRERTALPVDLFHARYRFGDRQRQEAATLEHYGRKATREGGRILVATQVVEQSLDLDFDWLVTQICPVDLLFQRLGRLHRHQRCRPLGFDSPRCVVLSVEGDDYGAHKLIYGNTRVLWRTERLLAQTDRIEFPDAYRGWIEPVYREDDWDGEPEAVSDDYWKFHCEQGAAEKAAKEMISLRRKQYADDDVSIAVNTRDGEMSLTVLPVRTDGRLLDGSNIDAMDDGQRAEALNLNTVPVPYSWRRSALSGCPQDDEDRYRLAFVADTVGAWVSRLGKHVFRYTEDVGLERGVGDLPPTL